MRKLQRWLGERSLNSQDSNARLRAIEKLAALSDPQSVTPLIDALNDTDSEVRACAAGALGKLGDPRAIEPLVAKLLRELEMPVLESVAGALSWIDERKAMAMLQAHLDDQDISVSQAAAWGLRRVGWDSLSGEEKARIALIRGDWDLITEIGVEAVAPLSVVLVEGTHRTRTDAAEALAQIGTPEAIQAIVDVLADFGEDQDVKEVMARALRRLCPDDLTDVQQAMICVVLDEWADLVILGSPAVGTLTDVLNRGSARARERAAQTLGKIRTAEALDVLLRALSDTGQEVAVRAIAVKTLAEQATPATTEAIARALDDEAWEVRTSAAGALEQIGWKPADATESVLFAIAKRDWAGVESAGAAAVEPLVKILQYSSVGADAGRMLIALGSPGVEALVAVVKDTNQPPAAREVAATTLSSANDARAIEPLITMLEDPDMGVRQTAAWTLERVGWQPSDPWQQAVVAIAHEDWDEVCRLGESAVEPLIQMATNGMARSEPTAALEYIIETSPGSLSIGQLRTVVALGDPPDSCTMQVPNMKASLGTAVAVDYKRLRELARFELLRRGVMT